MPYLLRCCFDETRWAQLPDAQQGQITQEYRACMQGLVTSGHSPASAKLHPTAMATTVRQQHGQRITTDGPFAETAAQLGGYHLIECQDLDEALAIAVRPVMPASAW
jgi:hypothetical protein